MWILKPSDGGRREQKVMDTLEAIEAHFDALEDGSIAWVASEYIKKLALLRLSGGSSRAHLGFVRCELRRPSGTMGSCGRAASPHARRRVVKWPAVHLFIASRPDQRLTASTSRRRTGLAEDFDAYLKQHHNSSVEALAARWRSIIKETLDAAREFMEVDKSRPTASWAARLHGRQRAQGRLVEVNSYPAIARRGRQARRTVSRGGLASRRNGTETAFVRVE